MQTEKDYFCHYNVFEHSLDFEIVFRKSDHALLVYNVLDNNVCLFEIDYYNFLLLGNLFD